MDQSKITFVIPAYNEANTIQQVVRGVASLGTVVVVNDCSKDRTRDEAVRGGGIVITNEKNIGYEGSIEVGFLKAIEIGSNVVVTMDADGQHRLEDIQKVINEYKRNRALDLVIGHRSETARFSEWLFRAYFFFRFRVNDPMCGLKLYVIKNKKDFLIFDRHKLVGSELLLKLLKNKKHFKQVAILCPPREDVSRYGNFIKANWKIMKALIKIIYLDLFMRNLNEKTN